MSERTGIYTVEGIGVQEWDTGVRVRMRACPEFQGVYLGRAVVIPGWGIVERDDHVLDIGPLRSWEPVEA